MSAKTNLEVQASEVLRKKRLSKNVVANQSQPYDSSVGQIIFLQRTIGNQALNRLCNTGVINSQSGKNCNRIDNKVNLIQQKSNGTPMLQKEDKSISEQFGLPPQHRRHDPQILKNLLWECLYQNEPNYFLR